jgi:hypothetical protein
MTYLRPIVLVISACAALLCTLSLSARELENVQEFNPSDVYMQAWLLVRDAEGAEQDADPLEAYNKFQKATRLFDSVAFYYPDWKPNLVHDRREITAKSMEAVRAPAEAARLAKQKKTEILLEGPGQFNDKPAAAMHELSPAEKSRVKALQERIQALDHQLKQAESDRDENAARLRHERDTIRKQRDQLARAPLQHELADLNDNISRLQLEKNAMADALRKSRLEQQDALADLARLKTDTQLAQEKAAQIHKTLITERDIGNKVVQGLREQLRKANGEITSFKQQLAVTNQRNNSLTKELAEANAEITGLRVERDTLIKERDHMAALLKMNESDRVKVLIEENMKLGRELNQARDRLQALFDNNNTTKDQLIEAKRDLAVAKARILQLSKDSDEQTARLAELEERLQEAGEELSGDATLTAGTRGGSGEEVALLRSIITRQLRVQDRRRQAKELLVEAYNQDKDINSAISILSAQEVILTKEEEALVADHEIDGAFVFNDFVPAAQRSANNRALQQSIKVQTDAAHRAFANGRYMASREVFESVLLEHPGHVPTKIKLGIVHMRLRDYVLAVGEFSEAVAIRGEFPYASFMLGDVHYKMRELSVAREHLHRSLEMEPKNARAHNLLGVIAGDMNEMKLAENHFEQAIGIDPTLSDPYYNLSRIYQKQGERKKALELYQKAIINGGDPDNDFEIQLGS